jgi:hypothetical protein
MLAIACIGIAVGVLFLVSALANWDWYKGIVDFAAAEGLFGEDATRWLCGIIGVVAIGFGIAGLLQAR